MRLFWGKKYLAISIYPAPFFHERFEVILKMPLSSCRQLQVPAPIQPRHTQCGAPPQQVGVTGGLLGLSTRGRQSVAGLRCLVCCLHPELCSEGDGGRGACMVHQGAGNISHSPSPREKRAAQCRLPGRCDNLLCCVNTRCL